MVHALIQMIYEPLLFVSIHKRSALNNTYYSFPFFLTQHYVSPRRYRPNADNGQQYQPGRGLARASAKLSISL